MSAAPSSVEVQCPAPRCTGKVHVGIAVTPNLDWPRDDAMVVNVCATNYRTFGNDHNHEQMEGDL